MLTISHFSKVVPETNKEMASSAHIDSLAVMFIAHKSELHIHDQALKTFLWFPLTASYALVQPADSMSSPTNYISQICSIPCIPHTLLHD